MNQLDISGAAQQAADQTKSFLSKQVDERSTMIGEQISSTARDLRTVGDQVEATGVSGEGAARLARFGADTIEGIGTYLQDADMDRLIVDLESFTRKRPWAVAAGALTLGFAASRLLKSTSAQRYRTNTND